MKLRNLQSSPTKQRTTNGKSVCPHFRRRNMKPPAKTRWEKQQAELWESAEGHGTESRSVISERLHLHVNWKMSFPSQNSSIVQARRDVPSRWEAKRTREICLTASNDNRGAKGRGQLRISRDRFKLRHRSDAKPTAEKTAQFIGKSLIHVSLLSRSAVQLKANTKDLRNRNKINNCYHFHRLNRRAIALRWILLKHEPSFS